MMRITISRFFVAGKRVNAELPLVSTLKGAKPGTAGKLRDGSIGLSWSEFRFDLFSGIEFLLFVQSCQNACADLVSISSGKYQ
jgi:hypothetical protein